MTCPSCTAKDAEIARMRDAIKLYLPYAVRSPTAKARELAADNIRAALKGEQG